MTSRLLLGHLGQQIALSYVVFAVLVSLSLGLSLTAALRNVERNMLDDTLYAELAYFQLWFETAGARGEFHSRTTSIHVTPLGSLKDIPLHLRNLSTGLHNVTHKGRFYRVLIKELGGVRYSVQFDNTDIHQRQQSFVRVVWLSSLIILLLSLGLGWWMASRLARPTTRLANQIKELEENPASSLDISEYKNDEIGQLASQLQNYHQQLINLLQREKEFAGNVSHELRTPVTTISLAAEILATRPGLSNRDKDKVKRIQRATREMSELVDTFLILAKIDDTPQIVDSKCNLKIIVEEVIEQQRLWLGSKPVEVCLIENSKITVAAPARVLSVLIGNLVRNAFRYTNEGSIKVIMDEKTLSVVDTGIGINADTKAGLFKRNAGGINKNCDNVGLGLSIVQRICERYGWNVSFTSVEKQGSRFSIHF